jgi:hypothetical protein
MDIKKGGVSAFFITLINYLESALAFLDFLLFLAGLAALSVLVACTDGVAEVVVAAGAGAAKDENETAANAAAIRVARTLLI